MRIVRVLIYEGPEDVLQKHMASRFVSGGVNLKDMSITEVACMVGVDFLPHIEHPIELPDDGYGKSILNTTLDPEAK